MTYNVNYSDPANGTIAVSTGTIDTTTSITLVGKNRKDYGEMFAENFLHMLEHFAAPTTPLRPTQGQLWFNNDPEISRLTVYDGASWIPTNGVYRTSTAPTTMLAGDIWVNPTSKELLIYDGANWVFPTAGQSFSAKTGSYPEIINGNDGADHYVILNYLNGDVVSILARESFTPSTPIDGFTNLLSGLNLSKQMFNSTTPRFNGAATEAFALKVTYPGTETVSANNFFRTDISQALSMPLTINNNQGVKIGAVNSTFTLEKDSASGDAVVVSRKDSSKIVFRINKAEVYNTILSIDGDRRGVSINKSMPDSGIALDVAGKLSVSSDTSVTGNLSVGGKITAINAVQTGSIIAWPGATIPAGWLVCNGDELTTAAYPALFGVVGTTYGSSAAGKFNLPNIMPVVAIGPVNINYIIKV